MKMMRGPGVPRWRKQPAETGLRSIGAAPRGYELRAGDEVLIRVAPMGGGALNGPLRGWYWYGAGKNTANDGQRWDTAEEAKSAADAYYKRHSSEWHSEGKENG